MKTPEYKGPAQLPTGHYNDLVKKIGAPPKGYRFLKIGEKSRKEDFHTPFGRGQWKNNEEADCYGDVIKGHMWPHIRKVDYVRGPKGRFVSTKPALPAPKATLNEEMISWINAKTDVSNLNFRIKEINAAIAGTSASGILDFHWTSTPQQNGAMNGYWCERWNNKNKISDSDREYMKLVVEAMEARVKVLSPKPKTATELLKDRIESLEKENAELRAWKAKVLAATI